MVGGVIVRAWTPSYDEIAAVTRPNVVELARNFKWAVREFSVPEGYQPHPSWAKLDFVIDLLARDLPVLWLDADVLVIDWRSAKLRYELNRFTFSTDSNGLCAGAFIAFGEWCRQFLSSVRFFGPTNRRPVKHEQDAIKALFEDFPGCDDHWVAWDQIATRDSAFTDAPPFAYHAWAGDYQDKSGLARALKKLASAWSPESWQAVRECE